MTSSSKRIRIKNVILDLGGVIINIDYTKTIQEFSNTISPAFANAFHQNQQDPVFDQIEKGLVDTTQALRQEFNCPTHVSDKTINDAWNAMLLDIPPERITMIETLKKTYRVFLLSNSNKVHIDRVLEIGERDLGTDVFRDKWGQRLFDKIYYSYEIGFRKPDVDAFEFVVNDARLVKEETLFVDDTIRHVRGGLAAGLNVWWINKEWPLTRIAEVIEKIERGENQVLPL